MVFSMRLMEPVQHLLMHDAMDETLDVYGREIISALEDKAPA